MNGFKEMPLCIHCIPTSPEMLSEQGIEWEVLLPLSVTSTEKPLSKLLNPGRSQWSCSGSVLVLSGCTVQFPSMSVKQSVAENENE